MKIPLVVFHLLKDCPTVAMTEGRHKLMNLTGVKSYIFKNSLFVTQSVKYLVVTRPSTESVIIMNECANHGREDTFTIPTKQLKVRVLPLHAIKPIVLKINRILAYLTHQTWRHKSSKYFPLRPYST